MTVTAQRIRSLVDQELARLNDRRVLDHIRSLLVEPTVVMRKWDYGAEGEAYPCWAVLDHVKSNSGIAYCEFGFGPRSPWGIVALPGSVHMSMGMDCDWSASFLAVYFDSMASELPIWRVFKQEGAHPGAPITEELDWDSAWKRLDEIRAANSGSRHYCSHSVQVDWSA